MKSAVDERSSRLLLVGRACSFGHECLGKSKSVPNWEFGACAKNKETYTARLNLLEPDFTEYFRLKNQRTYLSKPIEKGVAGKIKIA